MEQLVEEAMNTNEDFHVLTCGWNDMTTDAVTKTPLGFNDLALSTPQLVNCKFKPATFLPRSSLKQPASPVWPRTYTLPSKLFLILKLIVMVDAPHSISGSPSTPLSIGIATVYCHRTINKTSLKIIFQRWIQVGCNSDGNHPRTQSLYR